MLPLGPDPFPVRAREKIASGGCAGVAVGRKVTDAQQRVPTGVLEIPLYPASARAVIIAAMKTTLLLLAGVLVCAASATAEINFKPIEYQLGDTMLEGLHVADGGVAGKRPAVLIMHQWRGLGRQGTNSTNWARH